MPRAVPQLVRNGHPDGIIGQMTHKSFFRRPPVVAAMALIVLFFACDFGLAYLFLDPIPYTPNLYYHHALQPNFSAEVQWGPTRYPMRTDSLGMRIADRGAAPSVDAKYRILFLGDSFTEGIGVPYEQSFVALIRKRIREADSGIEVFNGGVASHSPYLYLLHLKDLIERHGARFNEVVVFIDVSDVEDEISYQNFKPGRLTLNYVVRCIKEYADRYSLVGHVLLNNVAALQPVFDELRFWVRRASAAEAGPEAQVSTREYYAMRDAWIDNDQIYRSWGARGVALCRKNLEQLAAYAKSKGMTVSFAIYPWPRFARHRDNRARRVFDEMAAEEHWTLVDLYPDIAALPDPGRLYIQGDVHWNAAGNRFVADAWIAHYCKLRHAAWCERLPQTVAH
jgi:lysophospholipase L1-like esterase